MSRTTVERVGRLLGLAAIVMLGGAVGCMPATQQIQTAHYTLSHPDYWKVKKTAEKDGDPTILIITQYGAAVIDEGAGSMASKGQNYDAVTADVEVRLYSWADPAPEMDATQSVGKFLTPDPELALQQHFVIPDNPPECGVYPKKYVVFGTQQTPVDLVKRPGWRTIVVGGRANGFLVGAVARVEFEPDMQRNCHNLSNMRVQLQNLLDGLSPNGATPAAGGATPPKP
jgi:hypothetical protein